jgi:D-beta-D-heptose 7-phosphate kinase/D-beta-D-heptose 1-phosphate adenosyltransferase
VSDRQQLLRIDYESPSPIGSSLERAILARVKAALRGRNSVDAVIVQDYAKGMLSKNLVRGIVKSARSARKPVLMDPNSKSSLDLYSGATFMTPNAKEAESLSGIPIRDSETLESAGAKLLRTTGSPYLVITLGKEGMAVFRKGSRKPRIIPTYAREVYDVSGAGDTVISVMALAIASGAEIEEAAVLGNLGAGVVVGKRGTATVTPEEMIAAMSRAAGPAPARLD